jgi:hypothetical protein
MAIRKNNPLKICYVLKRSTDLGNVNRGERIAIPPRLADILESRGVVSVVAGPVLPQDLQDVGGIDAYLKKNEKARKVSPQQEKMLVKQIEKTAPPKALPPNEQV